MSNNKFVLVPVELLKNLKELAKGTEYEDDVKKVLDSAVSNAKASSGPRNKGTFKHGATRGKKENEVRKDGKRIFDRNSTTGR